MKNTGLIILAIVTWILPAVMAFLFKDVDILLGWLLSWCVTDEILDKIKAQAYQARVMVTLVLLSLIT